MKPIKYNKAVAHPVAENFYDMVFNEVKVGNINIDKRLYITPRDPREHFMRKYNAWGISEDVINLLMLMSVERVIIRTHKQDYLFYLKQFIDSSLVHCDEGNDWQRFVSIGDPVPEVARGEFHLPKKKEVIDLKKFGVTTME